MALKTNYKDDVFTGKRKYTMTNNSDGTVSFTDATTYSQTGDSYGAAQINEQNTLLNTLNSNTFAKTDTAETALADADYFPFYDTSASKQKKTLWSNIINVLKNTFAIKTHDSTSASTYGAGTSSRYGHVKLSDSYTSSAGTADQSQGASSYGLFSAYSALNNAIGTANTNISGLNTSLNNKYSDLTGELTANGKRLYMDYKNGKYGINTSANRGADTFIPFSNIQYLTSGSTWNGAFSYNASGIAGYQNLTVDNFFIVITEVGTDGEGLVNYSVTPIQYDATTGIVSIPYLSKFRISAFKLYYTPNPLPTS